MALNKKDLQEAKKLVEQINAEYKKMGKGIKFPMPDSNSTLQDFKAINDELRAIKKDADEAAAAAKRLVDETKRTAEEAKATQTEFRNLQDELAEVFQGIGAAKDEIGGMKDGFKGAVKSAGKLTDLSGELLNFQKGIGEYSAQDIENIIEKAEAEKLYLQKSQQLLQSKVDQGIASKKEEIALKNVNGILEEGVGNYDQMVSSAKDFLAAETETEKKMGLLGAGAEGLSGVLDKLGMGGLGKRLGIDDALKSTKAMVRASGNNVGSMETLQHLAKGLGKNLMKSLGPAALLAMALEQLVKAFKLIDGASGEIAKSQGLSAAEGRKIVANANETAIASGDILISTQDIVKSQSQLNKLMGTSMNFPAQMAIDMNTMSEKLGLSEQSMNFFAKNALKGKGSIQEQLQATSDVTMQMNQQEGLTLSLKDIQEGIGSLTASQRLTAKGNVKELANQVYQSKLLGLSASQLEGVQNSLLDFESSIAAEMEAELMTGKQLNLEGARAAALAGDQAALAAEMRKEVGTIAEFESMNVMQRESLAKAFGLNVDQMAEMLNKQEALETLRNNTDFNSQSEAQEYYNKLIDEGMSAQQAADAMKEKGIDDALAAQMKSATVTDKMSAITDKLTDLFIAMMEPLMPIFDVLMDLFDQAIKPMMPVFKGLVQIIGGALKPIIETIMIPTKLIMDAFKSIGEIISTILPEGTEMGNIFGMIGEAAGSIISIFILPMQVGIRFIMNQIEGMISIFGGVIKMFQGDFMGGLKDIVGGFVKIIISPFQTILDLIIGTINLAIKAANMIPLVNIPEVPEYQLSSLVGLKEGGVVPATPGGMPAVIAEGGEAEAVVPLSKAGEMGFGGNSKDIIAAIKELGKSVEKLQFQVNLNGAEVGRGVALSTSNLG